MRSNKDDFFGVKIVGCAKKQKVRKTVHNFLMCVTRLRLNMEGVGGGGGYDVTGKATNVRVCSSNFGPSRAYQTFVTGSARTVRKVLADFATCDL